MKTLAVTVIIVFLLTGVAHAQRGYAKAMGDRLKRARIQARYWENQSKLYNMLALQEQEALLEYKKRAYKRKSGGIRLPRPIQCKK